MSGSLLHRALEIFERLVDLPEAERVRALREQCGDDEALANEVTALLDAERAAPDYFADLSDRLGISALVHGGDDAPMPETIGPYRIVDLVGRGGMGAVYLAERDDEFQQRVAIKVLPLSLAGREARERFKAERQILARLKHPNIAALYDGGVAEDATLYFVMEYVEGAPFDEACDTRELGIEERIELFLQVCDAVSYAHRNLVVHRDLKPANILVDDSLRVRLLDFGIAKVLDEGEDAARLTRAGHRRMTPRYASPELVRGENPTTASDVYSLGVLLHELLTGRTPYRGRPTTEVEFARAIEEQDLGLASQRIAQENDDTPLAVVAQKRSTTPKALERRLRGDLDAILAKAMQKDPERRYHSVDDLADDLRRHLRNEPIRARTPSPVDRVQKFVRRHRAGVLAASVSTLALIGLVVTSVVYAINTRRQSQEILAQRERAEEIRDFLLGIFEVADPNESKGESVTARELLDRGAERVREDLETQPRTRATLMETIAKVYDRLSLYDRADAQYAEAMTLLEDEGATESDEYVQIVLGRASMLERKGQYDAALPFAERALEHYQLRADPVGLVQSGIVVGRLHHRLGDVDTAEQYYRQALSEAETLEDDDRLIASEAWTTMGTLMVERGDYAAAEEFHREALAIRKALLGDDLSLIEGYYNLGLVARRQGRLQEAKRYYEDALALTARLVPEGHADDAFMLNGLGMVHRDLGELDQAAERFSQAADVSRRFVGERHPFVGFNTGNEGSVRLEQGQLALADSLLTEALSIVDASVPNHPISFRIRADLGECLLEQGRFTEAETLLLEAHTSAVRAQGDDHEVTRRLARQLADLYTAQGDPTTAAVWAERAESLPNEG